MNYLEIINYLNSTKLDNDIYLEDDNLEKNRYRFLIDETYKRFGDGDYHLISSPGRTEIGGNHTDHQHGNTLSATIAVDNVCACKKSDDNIVTFYDSKLGEVTVDLSDLVMREEEKNTSIAIIRGIAYKLKEKGYKVGGFKAYCDSRVLVGASISSSACFEMMIFEIFNVLYNDLSIGNTEAALIGQFAENEYFGKASGLLDQLTIATGGLVGINFNNPNEPIVEKIAFDFEDYGYDYLIVDTKGDHANLSNEYSSIPKEMAMVSKWFSKDYLADVSFDDFVNNMKQIRENIKNDRAILRAFHFFKENNRAVSEKEAIKRGDIDSLLELITDSGRSSYMYLQNVYSTNNLNIQNVSLALAMSESYIKGNGAYRIQGGGFEGTIIAIVKKDMTKGYIELMESIYGKGCVLKTKISKDGVKTIL